MDESAEFKEGTPPYKFLARGGGLKDVQVELPPGFVGNPNAVPKCPYAEFLKEKCPDNAALGEATVGIASTNGFVSSRLRRRVDQAEYFTEPVYNVEPAGGVAAELGFWAAVEPVFVDARVRTGGDYGITVGSGNVTEGVVIYSVKVTVWGVPAEASHDRLRGKCLGTGLSSREEEENEGLAHDEEESVREEEEKRGVVDPVAPVSCPAGIPAPFLTNPTSCGVPRTATLSVDSWDRPGNFATGENVISESTSLPELVECDRLDFSPTLTVAPDGTAGSTPTGLNVDVHVPQESTVNPAGLGEADVKDTTVTLPAGVQISPSAADGLQACSNEQIGFTGVNPVSGSDEFTDSAPSCPDASKIANVRIATPLLEHELTGAVYLAAPQNLNTSFPTHPTLTNLLENPFGSLIAMYLVAEEEKTGVLVKLPGEVALCETAGESLDGRTCEGAGQITTTFEDTPQLPFSDLQLEFYWDGESAARDPGVVWDVHDDDGVHAVVSRGTPGPV